MKFHYFLGKKKRTFSTSGVFYTRPGKLTRPGPNIRNFISDLPGKTQIERIESLLLKISSIPTKFVPREDAQCTYANRTAEDIVRDNQVYATSVVLTKPDINGCVDRAHVAVACIRAMGLPAQFVRHGNHSYAVFRYLGKEYEFDPLTEPLVQTAKADDAAPDWREFRLAIRPREELLPARKELIRRAVSSGRYHAGKDAEHMGLNYGTYFSIHGKKASR